MEKKQLKNKIIEIINNYPLSNLSQQLISKKNIFYKNKLLEETQFLPLNTTISERAYCYINNINTNLKCPICKTNTLSYISFTKGYMKTCSQKCSGKNKNVLKARIKTNIERYGIEHPIKKSIFLKKMKETNLKKYGVEYPILNQNIKEKIKETNLKKYGVEYIGSSKKIQYKIKITNILKYWNIYSLKSQKIQYKIKITNILKYWNIYPSASNFIKKKMKETNLKKYGVEYIGSSKKIQEKIKNTKLKKYGKENIWNLKKTKENIIKYNKICNNKYNLFITNWNKIGKVYHIDCNACWYKTDVTWHFIYNRIIKIPILHH